MAENLGPGVSRVLEAADTAFEDVVFQAGKPPCDAEFILQGDIATTAVRSDVLRGVPSGFLGNETNTQSAYLTNSLWSNWFKFGPQRTGELQSVQWANVHGWLIPVTGTRTGTPPGSPNNVDSTNIIALDPPPANSGDFRIDFVFLEVWKARIQPNPSATNKPASSAIYRYGNVEGGFSFLADDLVDPTLGFETTQRTQIQYRIRVVKGLVGLTSNPDGFDPVVVKAQGAATTPTSYTFTNMRQALGDPGLWRAGDGTQNALGTVDGYSYAIPISAIFRRNSVSWLGEPSQNLNGGFSRNPTAVDRTGIKTFSTVPTLSANLSAVATSASLVSALNIPLPINPATPVLIQIGDELMTYVSINTGTNTINTLTRGVNGTVGEFHKAGSVVRIMSGRPDGLFSDQIALTDILDLRHCVNPNGFDYDSLLNGSLDKLLRGQLRSNWKRSGAGPQGPVVFYQDAIKSGGVSLGVTKLDAPDNIRMVFSDAATVQPIELMVAPIGSAVPPGPGLLVNVTWDLQLTVKLIGNSSGTGYDETPTSNTTANQFSPGDILQIPVNQLKNGLPGGDTDQVRWVNDAPGFVSLRFDGDSGDIPSTMYSVFPAIPGPSDDLFIVFGPTFPAQTGVITAATPALLHIKVNAVYGPGRGVSRRPDMLHSVSYINPSADLLVQQSGVPSNNQGSRIAWAPLWSKFRSAPFNNLLPVTSEVYADLGSKSLLLTPFRKIDFPVVLTVDGDAANPGPDPRFGSATTGTKGLNSPTLTAVPFTGTTAVGDALIIASGPGAGRYTILSLVVNTSITVDRPIRSPGGPVVFTVHQAQGVMPLLTKTFAPKWTTTDPLEMFCGTTFPQAAQKNIFVSLPRHLVPGWGEVRLPILPVDALSGTFSQGINFGSVSKSGSVFSDADKNYVNYNPVTGGFTYAAFSTLDLQTSTPSIYNGTFLYTNTFAGMRKFTDTRGLERQGLELPPFYGVARLFGVYEANDYKVNGGSPFNSTTRAFVGGAATNLLRQNMTQADGPTMWIEIDDDGDSTFILNANAIDITRSPNPLASFAAGDYVIEASIFGFDRGTFDLNSEARLVLTRPSGNSWSLVAGLAPNPGTRPLNINRQVAGPAACLPGPAEPSDQVVINYTRTPYGGDPWGSQATYIDLPYDPGPLTTADAFQLASTRLNQSALTRPNQKVLEVLAAKSFSTTLGSGRYSADATTNLLDFKDVAYEDPTAFPPTSGIDPRPNSLPGNFQSTDLTNIGSEYLSCSERLPLGSLFRDKDFRGQVFGATPSPLVFSNDVGVGHCTGLAVNGGEQYEALIDTASSGVGSPGDVLVHVDGEPGNYSLLTNFRVQRGGSVFTGNGAHPGGEISLQGQPLLVTGDHTNVLVGRAMLVRNAVTNVGATEVSAGDELMLLVITNVVRPTPGAPVPGDITIGTQGSGEGYAAADLYRIDGHPLTRNNVHMNIDPATIALSKRSSP